MGNSRLRGLYTTRLLSGGAPCIDRQWESMTITVVLFLRVALGTDLARFTRAVRLASLPALAQSALAIALLAIPADKALAHDDNSAVHHAETYPLLEAANAGDLDSVNHFIASHMADVDAKDTYGNAPLHKIGNASIASVLIAAEANVNAKNNSGNTPLYRAAGYNGVAVISILIVAGANVNAQNNSSSTPLHRAVFSDIYNRVTVVSVLIAAGADVNTKNYNGDAPLHGAARNAGATDGDRIAVISVLIAAGADVNAKNNNGNTPIHEAAENFHVAAVSMLIAAEADVNAKDNDGNTPLRKAARRIPRIVPLISALLAAGGHWGEACANAAVVNPAGPSPDLPCANPRIWERQRSALRPA